MLSRKFFGQALSAYARRQRPAIVGTMWAGVKVNAAMQQAFLMQISRVAAAHSTAESVPR